MMDTQLKIAPAKIPLAIIGTVILKKVFSLEVPNEIAASSMVIGICWSTAIDDRIVDGTLRMVIAMTIIAMVAVNTNGFWLKLVTSAIPTTEPGITNGIIEVTSMILFRVFLRRTTR